MCVRRTIWSLILAAAIALPFCRAGAEDAQPLPIVPAAPAEQQPPAAAPAPNPAQPAAASSALQISWEVRNRFRLFREERDFTLHVDAIRGKSILESEDALAIAGEGRGWARNMHNRLCIDQNGKVMKPCVRDDVAEDYLAPADHPVTIRLSGDIPAGAMCAWTFDDGDQPLQSSLPCTEPINLRVRYGHITNASVDLTVGDTPPQHLATAIAVRDFLIAGLGDSIASGEGNPDRAVALSDEGFCFRSYLDGSEYYRPGRAGYNGDKTCTTGAGGGLTAWQQAAAQWSDPACHRSLYSYQARAALALAARFDHIAVTFLPLACSGATIANGLLGPQRGRECVVTRGALNCQRTVEAQIGELTTALAAARQRQPQRSLDLVFLTIGANDIGFSGLVADAILQSGNARALFRRIGVIGSVADSRAALTHELPHDFTTLRQALRPLVDGDLSRVVFVSYADPVRQDETSCGNGRDGFDIHPSFNASPDRMAAADTFVHDEFLPELKALAQCDGDTVCDAGGKDRMTLVDQHQQAFAQHSLCAHDPSDPEFDRECFSMKGDSFNADPATSATSPMACGRSASEFRAYLPRQRWLRTANDSYFAAMTYPQGYATQPSDIHDATWGVLSAVYGGAVHPTAEGHAAMADAAMPAVLSVLGLSGAATELNSAIVQEPLPPPGAPSSTAPTTTGTSGN